MNQKGFSLIFIVVGLVLIISLAAAAYYSLSQNKNNQSPSDIRKIIQSPIPTEKASINTSNCLKEGDRVDYTMPQDGSDGILAIIKTDIKTKETDSFVIEGVAEKVNDPVEIQKCYVYVIKPINEKEWELWRYNYDQRGQMIYKGNRFQFRVNKQETFAAINTYDGSKEYVLILDIESKNKIKELAMDDLKNNLGNRIKKDILDVLGNDLRSWNEKGSEVWGGLYVAAQVYAFWKLDVISGKLEVFTDLYEFTLNGVLLNPDKEIYAYSDKPIFFDTEGENEWLRDNKTYSIYLYSLRNKISTKVVTLPSSWPGGMASPLVGWDSPTELRYSTPEGQKVYKIKD